MAEPPVFRALWTPHPAVPVVKFQFFGTPKPTPVRALNAAHENLEIPEDVDTPPLAVPSVTDLANPIDFSSVKVEGFAVPEPHGCWTNCEKASLRFRVDSHYREDVLLMIEMAAYLAPPNLTAQLVDVTVNGVPAGTWTIDKAAWHRRPLILSTQLLGRSNSVLLGFSVPTCRSPASLGLGPDIRKLGITVRLLSLAPLPVVPARSPPQQRSGVEPAPSQEVVGCRAGTFALEQADGVICARLGDGGLQPICESGTPVTQFLPGWSAEELHCGRASVCYLKLAHPSGQRAVWFLDAQLNHLGDTLAHLPEGLRTSVEEACAQDARVLWHNMICATDFTAADHMFDLLNVGRAGRRELLAQKKISFDAPAHAIVLHELDASTIDDALHPGTMAGEGLRLDLDHIRGLLRSDFLACQIEALRSSSLRLPSPISGRPLQCRGSIILTSVVAAYRFVDDEAGLPFYVFAADWYFSIVGVLFPTLNLLVHDYPHQKGLLESLLHEPAADCLFREAVVYADILPEYLGALRLRPVMYYFYWHLGHHLWNELTGLHMAMHKLPVGAPLDVFVAQSDDTEMYGLVDELFPALSGHVHRTIRHATDIPDSIYEARHILVRPTGRYVTRALAQRIIQLADGTPESILLHEQYARLQADGFQLIVLGLRVENRTLADLAGFCRQAIGLLQRELGKVAVVLDGHNRRGSAAEAYRSHRDEAATAAPIEVELGIVQQLAEHVRGHNDVILVSTVGAPMSTSIFWSSRARFFITPWGAGLAKYRWVCNTPGLILTNRSFLSPRWSGVLHLYDSEEYMEEPTPVYFLEPDDITDEPTAPVLIPDPRDPGRGNFSVDLDAIWNRVAGMIRDSQPPLCVRTTALQRSAVVDYQYPDIVVVGDSHVDAIMAADRETVAGEQTQVRLHGLRVLDPKYRPWVAVGGGEVAYNVDLLQDYSDLIRRYQPVAVVMVMGGNEHFALGAINDPRPFDFVLPDQPNLETISDTEIIPYHLLRERLLDGRRVAVALGRELRARYDVPIYAVSAPPPVEQSGIIKAHIPDDWADVLAVRGVAPSVLRYKLWRATMDATQELCKQYGLEFIDVPAAAVDENGFLREEYRWDALHGNVGYGHLVVGQLVECVRGLTVPGVS